MTALPWPFLSIVDEIGRPTGFMILEGPLRTPRDVARYEVLRERYRFIGFTSYHTFPDNRCEGDDRDYARLCEAWCHCFRNPDALLPRRLPRALLSISDFTDPRRVSAESLDPSWNGVRDIDFVYVCGDGWWQEEVKNWRLAQRCLPRISDELGLEGLIIGRTQVADLPRGARVSPPMERETFLRLLMRARFLFVPNILDASPRILAEAMLLDTPVVVNRSILGGWKYVNAFTGTTFTDENDVVAAVGACLGTQRSPRRWFSANHGAIHAGRRLTKFLRSLDSNLTVRCAAIRREI